jgi:hypothetical protein
VITPCCVCAGSCAAAENAPADTHSTFAMNETHDRTIPLCIKRLLPKENRAHNRSRPFLRKPSSLPVSAVFYFASFRISKHAQLRCEKQHEGILPTVQGNRPKVERVVVNVLAEHMRFSP